MLYVLQDLGAEGFGQVGEVHVNVRHPRFETVYGVEVARGRPDRPADGKTVTARFELEIDPALGRFDARFELEAVDLGGHPDSHGPLE